MADPFSTAEEELFTVSLDQLSYDTIRRVSKVLGISSSLRTERKGIVIIDKITKLAQKAAQSTVPINTGELRSAIDIERPAARPFRPYGRVYVNGNTHVNSYHVRKPTNSGLARLLDEIQQKRSRNSQAESPFSSASSSVSQFWITDARKQLSTQLQSLDLRLFT